MSEIQLTQGKVATVDDADFDWLSKGKWYARKSSAGNTWYAMRKAKKKTVLMHRSILEINPEEFTDHKNFNGLDNRRCNLRVCTNAQNQHNARKRADNTSGYKGVTKRLYGKWEAKIRNGGKQIYLGTFSSLKEAVVAYNNKAKELHGEFACLNEIKEGV